MRKFIKIFGLLLPAAGILLQAAAAGEVKFEASLDRNKIAIGETAQLGLSFYGTQSMPAPDVGRIDGLEIRYTGPSTMMTVINGEVSSSVTHMYTVAPLRIGKFQIGPFSFKYKGDNYTSNMVFLESTEEKVAISAKALSPDLGDTLDLGDRIFLKLGIGKTTAYVNELIPISVKLYVHRLNVGDIQLPTFSQEGFSKVEFREPKQYREELDGLVYEVLEFNTSIFGTRPGDYRLGPSKLKCNVMLMKKPSRGQMRDDPFGNSSQDPFYDNFFSRYEKRPVELKSEDAQIIVSPLPEEARPRDFSGAVGDYQFIFSASPTKVKVGDPITLRMSINGNGNFNTVLIPRLEDVDGFRMYDAQVETHENSKMFTQVLIPEKDNLTAIPKASFSYFNPSAREYKRIVQGPIPIQLEKAKEEAPSQVVGPLPAARQESPAKEDEMSRDIIYIKESPGILMKRDYQIYKNVIFFVLLGLPLPALVLMYGVQARRKRMERDTVYAGRIMAFRVAKKGLRDLRHKMELEDGKVFYEEVFKTLQNYLGNRLHIPVAGITFDAIVERLAGLDMDLDILRKLKGLFETCDKARFAFFAVAKHKMSDDLKELKEVMDYFERRKI